MRTTPSPGTRENAIRSVSIAVGLLVVALVVAFPLLTTHYVTQDDSQIALLSWRELAREAFPSARISGRFYFLFSMWFGWIPYAIDRFAYFKTVQMLGLAGNFLALWYLARRLTGSGSLAFLALLFGLVTMQARWEHNLVAAFPWGFSTSLTLVMVAIGLFADFLDGGNRRKQLLSSCLFFLSLLNYESFLLYAVAFPLLAWPRGEGLARGAARSLRAIWPHLALGSLYLAAYVGFRFAYPTLYDGNQMRFSPAAMVAVWKTFGASALPGMAFGDLQGLFNEFSDDYAGYAGGWGAVLEQIRVEWMILAVVAGLLCALFLAGAAREPSGIRLGRAAVVAVVMATVPQIPHALTPRYQTWVQWGTKSHVPTYLAAFGLALLLACAVTAVASALRGAWPWTASVAAALAWVAVLTAFSNFYVARSQTIARRKWDLVDAVLRSEPFAAMPDDAVLLAPSWWHGINIMNVLDDYWTRYLRKKTGRHIEVVRSLAGLRSVCGSQCRGRVFFSKYAREGQDANQYMILAPIEGDPEQGLSAPFLDAFVLSTNHWFSLFAALRSEASSAIAVDGLQVTDSAKGSVWVRLDRRGEHRTPFRVRVSSDRVGLDPDSVVLSGYVDGDQFVGSVQPVFADGFYSEEISADDRWNWGQERATLLLRNDSSLPREVAVSFRVYGSEPSCGVAVQPQEGTSSTSAGPGAATALKMRIGPWQDSAIHFATDCARAPGDPRNLRFNLRSLRISERIDSGRRP